MCLAIPGKILDLNAEDGEDLMRVARVDFAGAVREVALAFVPEAGPGDWVIVHVGFAISVLEPEEALATLDVLRQLGAAGESLAGDDS